MPTGHDAPGRKLTEENVRRSLIRASLSMAVLSVLMPLTVQAAPPDFCRDYATAAINQLRAALANPGCVGGVRGPRWVSDERIHFQWCLTQPIPIVEAERGARTGYLRACRGI
jgi:hypothetical protein